MREDVRAEGPLELLVRQRFELGGVLLGRIVHQHIQIPELPERPLHGLQAERRIVDVSVEE
jgi:hypothetical protein